MSQPPLVSVVIAAWNRAAVLPETLRSVQAQSHRRLEVIIVDDGSTDDTRAVAQTFCENDPRLSLFQQPHQGIATARNTGVARACGDFVFFLDSDDVCLPGLLERLVALLNEDTRVNLSFCNYYSCWDGRHDLSVRYPADRPLPEGDPAAQLIRQNVYAIGAVLLPREMLPPDCRFDPALEVCGDWDLWLRLADRGVRARGTREPLFRYRRWANNVSNDRWKMIQGDVRVLEKNLRTTRRPELRPLYQRALARARSRLELARARQLLDDQPDAVPAAVWRAWCHYPRQLKWLIRYGMAVWPKCLGGAACARYVHRKIVQKY